MTASAKAVRFDDDCMWVELDDGRIVGVPLAWFPTCWAPRRNSVRRSNSAHWASIGTPWTRTSRSTGCLQGTAIARTPAPSPRPGTCLPRAARQTAAGFASPLAGLAGPYISTMSY